MNKKSNNLPNLSLVLVILVFLLTGFTSYLVYQNKALTESNNQSGNMDALYVNTIANYSVKYPQGFIPKESAAKPVDIYLSLMEFSNPNDSNDPRNFKIFVSKGQMTEKNFRSQIEGHILADLTNRGELEVDGVQAIRLDYEPTDKRSDNKLKPFSIIFFYKDDMTYSIEGSKEIVDTLLNNNVSLSPDKNQLLGNGFVQKFTNYKDQEFSLNLPPECSILGRGEFYCVTSDFTLSAHSGVGGGGPSNYYPKINNTEVGNNKWERSFFTDDDRDYSQYKLQSNQDENLTIITLNYQNKFSKQAQKYFESILSTFKFTN